MCATDCIREKEGRDEEREKESKSCYKEILGVLGVLSSVLELITKQI